MHSPWDAIYTAWDPGTLGGPGESPSTQFTNAICCRIAPGASVYVPTAFGSKAHRPRGSIFSSARMLLWTAFARHGLPGMRWIWRISINPVSPSTVSYHNLLGASVDDLATFGPKGSQAPEVKSWPCPHLNSMSPGNYGGTQRNHRDHVSPNAVLR